MNVECPRCKRKWTAHEGESEIDCNCHLICPDGAKTSDCDVTLQNTGVQYAYPTGIHNNDSQDTKDPTHRTYYCSVHDLYYFKVPITVPVDWNLTKLPRRLRLKMEY